MLTMSLSTGPVGGQATKPACGAGGMPDRTVKHRYERCVVVTGIPREP